MIIRLITSTILRKIRHVISSGEWRSKYEFLVRKPEGKPPLGRPRRRGKYNKIALENRKVGL
jgi:hypothetical protein